MGKKSKITAFCKQVLTDFFCLNSAAHPLLTRWRTYFYIKFNMKQLVCESCGGKELIRQGNVLVCSHCDTKYSVKEENDDDDALKIHIKKININFSSDFFETEAEPFRTEIEENNFNWTILGLISFLFGMAWCR